MRRTFLFFSIVAITTTAMLLISCKDDGEEVEQEVEQEDYNSKGRQLSISELDRDLFNALNERLVSDGKNEVKFSNIIWEIAKWDAESQWESDTLEIKKRLMANYSIKCYHPTRIDWRNTTIDSVKYKKWTIQGIKESSQLFESCENTKFTHGAIGSHNDNGKWRTSIILIEVK